MKGNYYCCNQKQDLVESMCEYYERICREDTKETGDGYCSQQVLRAEELSPDEYRRRRIVVSGCCARPTACCDNVYTGYDKYAKDNCCGSKLKSCCDPCAKKSKCNDKCCDPCYDPCRKPCCKPKPLCDITKPYPCNPCYSRNSYKVECDH